jgi:hypothetical protein
MATRLPASQRTREDLRSLIEGRLSTSSAKDELVKLATRLIVEEALEGEASDAVGRDYYEHGAQSGQGYRNGYRPGRLKTAEGSMEYSAPQIAGRDEPFRSPSRGHRLCLTSGPHRSIPLPLGLVSRPRAAVQSPLPYSARAGGRSYFSAARPVTFRRASGTVRSASRATGPRSRGASALGIGAAWCMGNLLCIGFSFGFDSTPGSRRFRLWGCPPSGKWMVLDRAAVG